MDLANRHVADSLADLGVLPNAIDRREHLRSRYDEAFQRLPLDLEPPVEPGVRHARHLYAVRVGPEAPRSRDDLMIGLRALGVGSSVHFKGIHMLTHYSRRCQVAAGDLPNATDWARRSISLPLYPGLSEADQDRVIGSVRALLSA